MKIKNAANPSTPREELDILSFHEDVYVRYLVGANHCASLSILQRCWFNWAIGIPEEDSNKENG